MDNNTKRFMSLFSGYTKAYGTYDARMLGVSGKQKPILLEGRFHTLHRDVQKPSQRVTPVRHLSSG